MVRAVFHRCPTEADIRPDEESDRGHDEADEAILWEYFELMLKHPKNEVLKSQEVRRVIWDVCTLQNPTHGPDVWLDLDEDGRRQMVTEVVTTLKEASKNEQNSHVKAFYNLMMHMSMLNVKWLEKKFGKERTTEEMLYDIAKQLDEAKKSR